MATNGACTPQSAKPPRLRTKRKSGLHLSDLKHNFAEVAAGSDVRLSRDGIIRCEHLIHHCDQAMRCDCCCRRSQAGDGARVVTLNAQVLFNHRNHVDGGNDARNKNQSRRLCRRSLQHSATIGTFRYHPFRV